MRQVSGEMGSVVAGAIFFGLVGTLVASASNQQAADARRADFESKGLQEVDLAPGTQARGAIFFLPPAGVGAFDTAVLEWRAFLGGTPVRVPLTGLAYEPPR
jgi:hypothetical protein